MPRKPAKKPQQPQHHFQLDEIKPLTKNQHKAFAAYENGKNLFLHGYPGTGKSYISLYLALRDLFDGKYKRIILVRSVVPGRDIGFLPGSVKEKVQVYEAPYEIICNKLLHRDDAYDILRTKRMIEFSTTSFLRSITWEDSIIIVDEIQNLTKSEGHTTLSRIGENCRVIVCGDYQQSDLKKYEDTCVNELMAITQEMPSFYFVEMDENDICRSGFAKEYILAKIRYEYGGQ